MLYVRTHCAVAASELGCNDDAEGLGTLSELTLEGLEAGQELFIFADGFFGQQGAYTLTLNVVRPE